MTGGYADGGLDGVPARFYLLWITRLTGTSGAWSASVSDARLLAETEPSLVPVAAGAPAERQPDQPVEQLAVGDAPAWKGGQ